MNSSMASVSSAVPRRPAADSVRFERFGFIYGAYTGASLIVLFLLMKVFGLHQRTELAYINGIPLVIGIVLALRDYKRALNGRINYLPGIGLSFLVSATASVLLALFFVLYSSIDKEFAMNVMTNNLFGTSLSVLMVMTVIVIQGTVGGTIIGFIAMQFFKRSDHMLDDSEI